MPRGREKAWYAAKASGAKTYPSDRPCKLNHEPTVRRTLNSQCVICANTPSKAPKVEPRILYQLEEQKKEKSYDEMTVRERMRNLKF